MFKLQQQWTNISAVRGFPRCPPENFPGLGPQREGRRGGQQQDLLEVRSLQYGQPHIVQAGLTAGLQQGLDNAGHGSGAGTLHHGDRDGCVAARYTFIYLYSELYQSGHNVSLSLGSGHV